MYPKNTNLDNILDARRPFLMRHTKHFLGFTFSVARNIFSATNLGWPYADYIFFLVFCKRLTLW